MHAVEKCSIACSIIDRASEDAIQESPCAQRADLRPESREITPEQQYRIEKNKLEAESKLLCKKFGADSLGATWIAALLPEFKKPYMEEVLSISHVGDK